MSATAACNILVIDDEPNLRASLAMILKRAGYTTTVAASAQEALEMFPSKSFDLVFLDLQMPGMSGMQLLPKLIKLSPQLPVVILTGNGSLDSAQEALLLGARGYLMKPINPWEIIDRVASILREEWLMDQKRKLMRDLKGLLPELNQEL